MLKLTNLDSMKTQTVVFLKSQESKFEELLSAFPTHQLKFEFLEEQGLIESLQKPETALLVLDYSIQDMAGILFFKSLSDLPQAHEIPVIFFSQSKSYEHRLNAFELGAADYIMRPCEPEEALNKFLVQIRNRKRVLDGNIIQFGNLTLDQDLARVYVEEQEVSLSQIEFKILQFLLTAPRRVITRTEVYENIWGRDLSSSGRLDTQLYNLKRKLKNFSGKIKSVNKIGLRILAESSTFSPGGEKEELQSQSQDPRP